MIAKRKPVSDALTFVAERTSIGDSCWEWCGSLNAGGYGVGRIGWAAVAKAVLAHRLAWEAFNGPITAGLHVLHRCDNRRCVRPDHLFLGTNDDNIADRVSKCRPGSQAWKDAGERHPNAKITDADCAAIRAMRSAGRRCVDLAQQFGVTPRHIGRHEREPTRDDA